MKIALVLLSCLVAMSTSYGQNFVFAPRIGYLPYVYGILPSGQQFIFDSEDEPNQVGNGPVEHDSSILGRSKFSQLAQNRFLLNSAFNIFGLFTSSSKPITSTVLSTSTLWLTQNFTVTTTTLKFCIPSASFAVQDAKTTLTAPCARRRREAILLDDLLDTIQPSETKIVETSVVADVVQTSDEPLLASSKDDENQVSDSFVSLRRIRRAATVFDTLTITLTSTFTSFAFVPAVVQKPIDLGAGLKCLPPGLAVCA